VVLALLLAAAGAYARGEGADGSFAKRESSHFVLFQDVDIDETGGLRGSRRFERQVLEDLEGAYDRLDQYLGLRPPRKLEVEIYDPAIFDRQFAGLFRFAAAGFYRGIVRVRGDDRFTDALSRVLHHELVHAALDAATPSAVHPGWFNEGLAEWFEARAHGKRRLDSWQLATLARAHAAGQLSSFESLGVPSFAHMSPGAAQLAYLQSYGLMEYLGRRHGERALREFCVEMVRTGDLHRTLRRVYRADLSTLEAGFISDLGS
jgi:hypothetical protein